MPSSHSTLRQEALKINALKDFVIYSSSQKPAASEPTEAVLSSFVCTLGEQSIGAPILHPSSPSPEEGEDVL
ncbi:hypothetical protein E2C01_017415 [Portunus trituberculatus]|uniref:Uncharacterized protein n=1 Tax=Portunus trituberculatus TaxID=210409 RepID=A0A5B7DTB3_PORTR|nr:hypothetical protein [Portunus trituberculatus]